MKINIVLLLFIFFTCSCSSLPEDETILLEVYFNPIGFNPIVNLDASEVIDMKHVCRITDQEILNNVEKNLLVLKESNNGNLENRIDFVCKIHYVKRKPELLVGSAIQLEYLGHLNVIDSNLVKSIYKVCGRSGRSRN